MGSSPAQYLCHSRWPVRPSLWTNSVPQRTVATTTSPVETRIEGQSRKQTHPWQSTSPSGIPISTCAWKVFFLSSRDGTEVLDDPLIVRRQRAISKHRIEVGRLECLPVVPVPVNEYRNYDVPALLSFGSAQCLTHGLHDVYGASPRVGEQNAINVWHIDALGKATSICDQRPPGVLEVFYHSAAQQPLASCPKRETYPTSYRRENSRQAHLVWL